MSVRNRYPLFGTIIEYLKNRKRRKAIEYAENELLSFIIREIRYVNDVILTTTGKNYLSSSTVIIRTRDYKEIKHHTPYDYTQQTYEYNETDDKLVKDTINVFIDWAAIRELMPSNVTFFYLEIVTNYGVVYFMNRPSLKKLQRKNLPKNA